MILYLLMFRLSIISLSIIYQPLSSIIYLYWRIQKKENSTTAFIMTFNFIGLNTFSVNKNPHSCIFHSWNRAQSKQCSDISFCNLPPYAEWKLIIIKWFQIMLLGSNVLTHLFSERNNFLIIVMKFYVFS